MVSIQQSSKITMNKFRVKINLLLYFVVNFMIIMVILVFFMVISVNRRLFRYFGSYSGISVIPVILVNRRTGLFLKVLSIRITTASFCALRIRLSVMSLCNQLLLQFSMDHF